MYLSWHWLNWSNKYLAFRVHLGKITELLMAMSEKVQSLSNYALHWVQQSHCINVNHRTYLEGHTTSQHPAKRDLIVFWYLKCRKWHSSTVRSRNISVTRNSANEVLSVQAHCISNIAYRSQMNTYSYSKGINSNKLSIATI